MVLLPDDPKVLGTLRDFVPEEDEAAAAMEPTMVQMESSRGRAVGELRVLMADLPCGYLCLFRRAAALRNSPIQLVRLEVAGAACRPQSQSALEAAERWIAEVLDLDTAAEYQTGVEDADEGGLVDEEDELVPNDPVNPTVQALLERISRLEGALQSRAEETVAPAAPLRAGPKNALQQPESASDTWRAVQAQGSSWPTSRPHRALREVCGPCREADAQRHSLCRGTVRGSRRCGEPADRLGSCDGPNPQDAPLADAADQCSCAAVASTPFGPFSRSSHRRGQRQRQLWRWSHGQGLRCSRSVSAAAGGRGQSGGGCAQERSERARRERGPRRAFIDAPVRGAKNGSGRPQDPHPVWRDLGVGLRAGGPRQKYTDAVLHSPCLGVCGAGDPRPGQDSFGMVDDGACRAAISDQPATTGPHTVCSTAGLSLGCCQRLIPEGHRHLQEPPETDRGRRQRQGAGRCRRSQERGRRRGELAQAEVEAEEAERRGKGSWQSGARRRSRGQGVAKGLDSSLWGVHSFPAGANNPLKSSPNNDPTLGQDGRPDSQFLRPVKLALACLRCLKQRRGCLQNFIRMALQPAWKSRRVETRAAERCPLWPVPPPVWRWTGQVHPGPRGRKRMQYHKCKALLAQHVICTLNWICLGYPSEVPQRAQAGEPLSESQTEVVARVEGLVEHFLHCPAFQVEDLGRTGEKFAALLQAAKELPERCQDVDLLNLLHDIRHHFDSYYQAEPYFCKAAEEHAASHQECRLDPASVRLPS